MNSNYRLLRAGEQKASVWSGGQTTELAIYPPGTSYAERNFEWRLSTAEVNVSESTFTALLGWERRLLLLTGQMHLMHAKHHQVILHPFEQDCFSGSWRTDCIGTGRDFNLMVGAHWQGILQALLLDRGEWVTICSTYAHATQAIYCFSGSADCQVLGEDWLTVAPGDFLQSGKQLRVHADCGTQLVLATIWPVDAQK